MLTHFWNRIRFAAWILLLVLLVGCAPSKQPFQIQLEQELLSMEQTEQNSPISGIRTGIKRQGITSVDNSFECTDDGVYFMCNMNDGAWLLFGDHNSDSMVKLCSLENCTHNDANCNAWFGNATNVCYFDGFLYTVVDMTRLYRVGLDGSGRSLVIDAMAVDGDYDGCMTPTVWAGVFSWFLTYQEDGITKADAYYYRLDGSMDEPGIMYSGYFGGNDGVEFVMNTFLDDNGNSGAFMYGWEPDTNARKFLVDRSEYQYGYWGVEASYVLRDGKVWKVSEGKEEFVLDIGLPGEYRPLFFPDCMVFISLTEKPVLNFFSWDRIDLGTVVLDVPLEIPGEMVICGETDQRIILTTKSNYIPEYYIEKSEFGSGSVVLHAYDFVK